MKNQKELFAAFLDQTKASGECGNVRFTQGLLYSYATPIAKICGNNTLRVTTLKYGRTTSKQCTILCGVAVSKGFTVVKEVL